MTMSQYGQSLLGAAVALRTALEQTADALATPRLAALLESEAGLAAALAVLPGDDADFGASRQQILHELARARQELSRCERLGHTLSTTLKHSLGQADLAADYRADGRHAAEAFARPASSLHTRG
jgi:hypothetical protein